MFGAPCENREPVNDPAPKIRNSRLYGRLPSDIRSGPNDTLVYGGSAYECNISTLTIHKYGGDTLKCGFPIFAGTFFRWVRTIEDDECEDNWSVCDSDMYLSFSSAGPSLETVSVKDGTLIWNYYKFEVV